MCGSGNTTLIISDKEMDDIMKIVESFEESVLLIKKKRKEKNGGFRSMVLLLLTLF